MSVLTNPDFKVAPTTFNDAFALISRSGLAHWAQERFSNSLGTYKGGQKAQLGFFPLLVGLALVAYTGRQMTDAT